MTLALDMPADRQRVVLAGVSWADYERTLEEIGNRPVRVAFLDGVLEIMSPLSEHEAAERALADLIAAMTEEVRIPRKSFGSTTFRSKEKNAGTEPDECFIFTPFAQSRE